VQASDQILEEIERLTPARLHRDVGFTPESGHVQQRTIFFRGALAEFS
jgi:hypothetical protein